MECVNLSYYASYATMTFSRLRCDQSHAPDDYQLGLQDIYHVRDCQHWSDGNIFAYHPRDEGEEFRGNGYPLWCCLPRREADIHRSETEMYVRTWSICYH